MKIKIVERLDLGELVTFIPNKNLPRYNWFYFKEGFSRDFVFLMLDHFNADENKWVLDPFLGCGTTALACREKGVNVVGVEISPLFHLISDVKVRDYNKDELKEYFQRIFNIRYRSISLKTVHPLLRKAFRTFDLKDIIAIRRNIMQIDDLKYRNFFIVALLNASSKASLLWKEKAGLRIKRRKNIPPFREMFRRTVVKMINDVDKLQLKNVEIYLYQGDARRMTQIDDESIDYVVTSPPYLNKIEYTKLYEIEYLLTYGETTLNPIRSYIGITISPKLIRSYSRYIPNDIPPAAKAYFIDMHRVLEEIYRVLKEGGRVAMVVGEGVFPDRIIEADKILADIAVKIGFKKPEIWIVNKRIITRSRTVKVGVARESIIFLRK